MEKRNYMKLEFPSKNCNVEFVCDAVASFATQLAPNHEELFDTKMAVTEIVENCIDHGYPNYEGIITIRCSIIEEEMLEIIIKDKGIGIPDIKQATMPLFTTSDSDHAGMGLTIAKNFMTNFKISSKVGKGTTVHMVKKIQG